MKLHIILAVLFCGILAEKEVPEYISLLSEKLKAEITKRLMNWDDDSSANSDASSPEQNEELDSLAGDSMCHFEVDKSRIIRTRDSIEAGAIFLDSPKVSSREECYDLCCGNSAQLSASCTLAVFKDKVSLQCHRICLLYILELHTCRKM